MKPIVWLVVALVGCRGDEPPEPKPNPEVTNVVPLAGQTFDYVGGACLTPTITQLRKQPNWMIQIVRKFSSYHDSWSHSVVQWTAEGATWHDPATPDAKSSLSPELAALLEQALAKSCEPDPAIRAAYPDRGEFYGFIWGVERASTYYDVHNTAMSVSSYSQVTLALNPIFLAAEAAHVPQRIALARTLRFEVSGHELVSPIEAPKSRWKARTIVVDLTKPSKDVPDADAVRFLDWAQTLREDRPAHLKRGPKLLEGTMTLGGKTRGVVVDLGAISDNDKGFMGDRPVFREILKIEGANYFKFSFD